MCTCLCEHQRPPAYKPVYILLYPGDQYTETWYRIYGMPATRQTQDVMTIYHHHILLPRLATLRQLRPLSHRSRLLVQTETTRHEIAVAVFEYALSQLAKGFPMNNKPQEPAPCSEETLIYLRASMGPAFRDPDLTTDSNWFPTRRDMYTAMPGYCPPRELSNEGQ